MKRCASAVTLVLACALAACGQAAPEKLTTTNNDATQDDQAIRVPAETTTTTEVPVVTTTPVAPTTTAAPVPTTVGPFSVKDVTISMGTCQNGYPPQGPSGATYGCVGNFTARLNPGVGGTLKWRADWMWWLACDQEEYSGVRSTEGSIAVPTGASQVQGPLEIYSETAVNAKTVRGAPAKHTPTVQFVITAGGRGSSSKTPFWGTEANCV